jgi:hydroxymethylbilane synthase
LDKWNTGETPVVQRKATQASQLQYNSSMTSPSEKPLRLGTRGSLLARMQSQWVADELMRLHPGLRVELEILKTTGDKVLDRPLHELGGKGLFTKELEQALNEKRVDFAVHSFKDVPVTMPLVDVSDLQIACVPKREDPRDLLISREGIASIDLLPKGARVGTGSLRRRAQLLAARPDLQIAPIRGNIDTRLRKLREGEFDAIVVATAGMKRSRLFDASIMKPIEASVVVPAPAQGALALQCRKDDSITRSILTRMDDPDTHHCVDYERMIVQALQGDCHSPIAALARIISGRLFLTCAVGHRDGEPPVVHIEQDYPISQALTGVGQMADLLLAGGALKMLGQHKSE